MLDVMIASWIFIDLVAFRIDGDQTCERHCSLFEMQPDQLSWLLEEAAANLTIISSREPRS